MNYLKKFESFGDYYFEITSDDYNNPKGDIEAMSENDFFSIRDKMRNKRWSVYSYKDTMLKNTENIKDVCEMTFDKMDERFINKLHITKMSDEWYYIMLVKKRNPDQEKRLRPFFKYYKADQLEGLLKLLEDIL